jgi:uncharacterized protein YjdB
MATSWLDDPDAEAIDLLGFDDAEEDYFDVGSDDAESSPAQRRAMRARRARIARAARRSRARSGALSPGRPATPSAQLRRTQAAVLDVDVDNKVQADAFSRALQKEAKRIDGAQAAVVGLAVGQQAQASFPDASPLVGAGLRGVPLLFITPTRRATGVGTILANPQWLGVGLIAGLAIRQEVKRKSDEAAAEHKRTSDEAAAELKRKSDEVHDIRITKSVDQLPMGTSLRFRADPLNVDGQPIREKRGVVTWRSSAPAFATVDNQGTVTPVAQGTTTITAEGETADQFDEVIVTVT